MGSWVDCAGPPARLHAGHALAPAAAPPHARSQTPDPDIPTLTSAISSITAQRLPHSTALDISDTVMSLQTSLSTMQQGLYTDLHGSTAAVRDASFVICGNSLGLSMS